MLENETWDGWVIKVDVPDNALYETWRNYTFRYACKSACVITESSVETDEPIIVEVKDADKQ